MPPPASPPTKPAQDEAAAAAAAPPPLLTREGFEARVKELFEEEKQNGAEAGAAAAAAYQKAQREQLAAAQKERAAKRAAPEPSSAAPPPKRSETSPEPPAVERDASEQVSFHRWEEVEQVAASSLEEILALYKSDGIVFVDPSFPLSDPRVFTRRHSLYASELTATTWKCRACTKRSPLPPPTTHEQLAALYDPRTQAQTITCTHCGTQSSMVEVATRPTGWERPSRVRDDVTLQFDSVPWVVFRGEPRPDDVRQGGVGNCWLVCAMSCLAETPARLRRCLVTQEFTHAGVYQVRLCHGGEWKVVTVDDSLPVNAIGCLAYLKAARRQLWVPLLEKAYAKLHGCYEALEGGTFVEAFSTLTGMPVIRIHLSRYTPPEPPPAGAAEDVVAGHTRQMEKWKKLGLDTDELYVQMYSYKQAGYAVGASTFARDANTEAELRAKGLNVPHAYSLIEVRTLDGGSGEEQLVKLRNPNGHAGWSGPWGRDSPLWTYDLKKEVGLDGEDSGVFWMRWDDFLTCFLEVTVCKLLPEEEYPQHQEMRVGGWLPSAFNAGQAVSIDAFAHTRCELSVYQEQHSERGEGSFALLLDIGLTVLKKTTDGSWELVETAERTLKPSCALSVTLEQDAFATEYLVIPLCFGQLHSTEPRKFTVTAHATQPLALEVVPLPAQLLREAAIAAAVKHGDRQPLLKNGAGMEALVIYSYDEEGGYIIVAENVTPFPMQVGVDASERTKGFFSSRGGTPEHPTLFTQDILPPFSRQILIVLTMNMKSKQHQLAMGYNGGSLDPGTVAPPGGAHIPDLEHLGALQDLHKPQPNGARAGQPNGGGGGAAPGGDPAAMAQLLAALMGAAAQQQQGQNGQGNP